MTNPEYERRLAHLLSEIDRDPLLAAQFTKIYDRDGFLTEFSPTDIQRELASIVLSKRWVLDLKARQIGSTTLLVFLMFVKALLTPGYKVLVVAQGHKAAATIFKMVHTFYENMSPLLKAPLKEINKTTMEFKHKGMITVTSANSNSVRGSTYQAILGSEVAFWPNPEETVAAIFQAVSGSDDTIIVLESTPNLVNFFHSLWTSSQHGMHKFFAPWTREPTYTLAHTDKPITSELRQYAEQNGLNDGQLRWAAETLAVKCLGSWPTFLQEYAVDPSTCFIMSGDSYFTCPKEWVNCANHDKTGWLTVHPDGHYTWDLDDAVYNSAAIYSIGCDPSSGSANGDYATICVSDVTNRSAPFVVATYMGRKTPKELLTEVKAAARIFNAPVNVDRTGGWGAPITDGLVGTGIKQYREVSIDASGAAVASSYGFNINATNRGPLLGDVQYLQNNGRLLVECPRLMSQMAKFAYINGRPDHQVGEHDDLLFALALSVRGAPGAIESVRTAPLYEPVGHEERSRYERKYGKPISQLVDEGMFSDSRDDEQGYSGW